MDSQHQQLLNELVKLAQDKEIPYGPTQLRKMQYHRLEEVMEEYKAKELDSVNETIVDVMIIKFEEIMKSTSMIRQDSKLAKKLMERKIFKRDLKYVVSCITPFLPFMGLVEGTVVVASEVFDNMGSDVGASKKENNDENKNDVNENESTTPQAEEGSQHD